MADRPVDSGQAQDKGPPRSKEGGGRGRRRRRKPDGNKAEPREGQAKNAEPKDGNVRAPRPEGSRGPRPDGPNRGPRPDGQRGGQRSDGGRGQSGGRSAKGGQKGERQRQAQPGRSDKPAPKPEKPEPPFKHVYRRYDLAVYDTFQAARADREALQARAAQVDQLNIVIRAEGFMDDPELVAIASNIKIFAGTAWALIHDRRVADGWYTEPR